MGELRKRFDLEAPLTAARPPFKIKSERESWINSRRTILLTAFNADLLVNIPKVAKKFREALEAVSKESKSTKGKLDAFVTEIEDLKKIITLLRN